MEANLKYIDQMCFEGETRGHKIVLDATSEHGGNNQGQSPKELVLQAMMGCTAMDVVSMLKKMRQEFSSFKMSIQGEKNKSHPIHFIKVKLMYYFEGEIEEDKAIKAIEASLNRYCGVNYMISKVAHIDYELFINGQSKRQGASHFIDPKD